MTFPSDRMLSAKDIAEHLHVTKAAVYKWTKEGSIPQPHRLGGGARSTLRWKSDEINAWLMENKDD